MKQPRKDVLREQLVLAADEIIRLRGIIEQTGWGIVETKAATWLVRHDDEICPQPSWVKRVLRRLRG